MKTVQPQQAKSLLQWVTHKSCPPQDQETEKLPTTEKQVMFEKHQPKVALMDLLVIVHFAEPRLQAPGNK